MQPCDAARTQPTMNWRASTERPKGDSIDRPGSQSVEEQRDARKGRAMAKSQEGDHAKQLRAGQHQIHTAQRAQQSTSLQMGPSEWRTPTRNRLQPQSVHGPDNVKEERGNTNFISRQGPLTSKHDQKVLSRRWQDHTSRSAAICSRSCSQLVHRARCSRQCEKVSTARRTAVEQKRKENHFFFSLRRQESRASSGGATHRSLSGDAPAARLRTEQPKRRVIARPAERPELQQCTKKASTKRGRQRSDELVRGTEEGGSWTAISAEKDEKTQ